jgi:hypothetical protein
VLKFEKKIRRQKFKKDIGNFTLRPKYIYIVGSSAKRSVA